MILYEHTLGDTWTVVSLLERKLLYVTVLSIRLFAQPEVETARVVPAFTRAEADRIAQREFTSEVARVKVAFDCFGEKGGYNKHERAGA